MAYQFASLPENPTAEDIKKEIQRLKKLKIDYDNKNSALKIILNSIYGVAGFPSFICYHRDVAQSITKQSEDLIKYTISVFNEYFSNVWHTLTDVHEKMGIGPQTPYNAEVVNYADTDSIFLVLKDIFKTSGYNKSLDDVPDKIKTKLKKRLDLGDEIESEALLFIQFIFEIQHYSLEEYVNKKLVEYVDKYHGFQKKMNGDKALKIEMEQLSHRVLWVKKKKYIKDPMWDKGVLRKSMSKLQYKGLELNQSATPPWVRKKLGALVEYIMAEDHVDTGKLLIELSDIKAEFSTVDVESIVKYERVTNYRNLILNDTTALEFGKGAKPHAKGAGYYNYLLHNSPHKNKYAYIASGDRIHYYYTQAAEIESFAFPSGSFPVEFAPPVNINMQFEKVFLGPLNNIIKVLGYPALDSNLVIFGALF